MPSAQLHVVRLYGSSPAIPPQTEVGVENVTSGNATLGSGDGPTGSIDIPIPLAGTNLSMVQAFAARVVAVGSPVTTISNLRFYVTQAGKNALGGSWAGMQLLTPSSAVSPGALDAFIETAGGSQGLKADYVQATRTLGAQGYVGDSIDDVYGISTVIDMLDDAYLGAGQIDLTGKGRADGTTATFGNSVNDVSRMLLLQIAFGTTTLAGLKSGLQIIMSYDEDE